MMSRVIAIHSFRGGTGKSNAAANVATLLAADGQRIGVVDTDLQSPGIHTLFGLDQEAVRYSLNEYLWGRCHIKQAAHDLTTSLDAGLRGRLYLVPSSIKVNDIARVIRDGYDVGLLNEGLRQLVKQLSLDVLLLDTHPGLNEETLLSIAMSNTVAIVMRPDQQDYEGTRVTLSVARKLKVPDLVLVVNKTPSVFDPEEVRERVAKTYDCEVTAVLPHSDELMTLSSEGVFALHYPDHPVTDLYRQIAARLTA
jgi:MinD-like ATPase involved in chromosome partitioning or flagellar assembly